MCLLDKFQELLQSPMKQVGKSILLYLVSYKIQAILSRNSQKWQNAVLSFIGRYSVKMYMSMYYYSNLITIT